MTLDELFQVYDTHQLSPNSFENRSFLLQEFENFPQQPGTIQKCRQQQQQQELSRQRYSQQQQR